MWEFIGNNRNVTNSNAVDVSISQQHKCRLKNLSDGILLDRSINTVPSSRFRRPRASGQDRRR
ncbi:hypothetical protein LN378_28590, partial [Enterobacter hormaechei subsp. steigerwaltii]|nr:hypothetical protein [Enterobacter hormaechei subsp. steigerwaltii]